MPFDGITTPRRCGHLAELVLAFGWLLRTCLAVADMGWGRAGVRGVVWWSAIDAHHYGVGLPRLDQQASPHTPEYAWAAVTEAGYIDMWCIRLLRTAQSICGTHFHFLLVLVWYRRLRVV